MNLVKLPARCSGTQYIWKENGETIARAYSFLMFNSLHPNQPFQLLEDVFVEEAGRGKGMTEHIIVPQIIADARLARCYKAIATSRNDPDDPDNPEVSRPHVHEIYRRCGYEDWGIEFRIDL